MQTPDPPSIQESTEAYGQTMMCVHNETVEDKLQVWESSAKDSYSTDPDIHVTRSCSYRGSE